MRKTQYRERPATAPAAFAEHGAEEETHLKPSELYYDDETQKIYYRVMMACFLTSVKSGTARLVGLEIRDNFDLEANNYTS